MKTTRLSALFAACLLALATTATYSADEWPAFRGPHRNGHSDAVGLPLKWSESENVAWKTALPGKGHSSPVVSGNQIWVTTAVEEELTPEEKKARLAQIKNSNGLNLAAKLTLQAICVDRETGKLLHTIDLLKIDSPEPVHSLNSYASPTPIIDGRRLFCHFGSYGLACVDLETNQILWKNTEHHVDHQNGPGASPALWRDLLIINYDGIDNQYVAAINKESGRTEWKTPRSGEMDAKPEFRKAYCTPIVVEDARGPQVISPGANWLYSYDPATGRELWKASYGTLGFSTVPRPIVGHGLVFVSTSFIRPRLLAVRYDGSGDVTETHIEWKIDGQLPQKPSMLLVEDELYFVTDSGIGFCLDARTGKENWKERISGSFAASPLYADGRIYYFSQDGRTIVLKPGSEYVQLAENKLDTGFMASPAVAGKALFLRTETHLYRIENSK